MEGASYLKLNDKYGNLVAKAKTKLPLDKAAVESIQNIASAKAGSPTSLVWGVAIDEVCSFISFAL